MARCPQTAERMHSTDRQTAGRTPAPSTLHISPRSCALAAASYSVCVGCTCAPSLGVFTPRSQAPLLTPHQNLACRLDALCGAAKRPLTVCGRWHRGRWQLASLAMERALTDAGESVVASPSAKAMSHPPLPPVRALPVARLDCCQGLLLCLGSSQGGQTRSRAGTRTAAGPRQRQRQGHIQRGDARRGRRFRRQRRRPQRQLS